MQWWIQCLTNFKFVTQLTPSNRHNDDDEQYYAPLHGRAWSSQTNALWTQFVRNDTFATIDAFKYTHEHNIKRCSSMMDNNVGDAGSLWSHLPSVNQRTTYSNLKGCAIELTPQIDAKRTHSHTGECLSWAAFNSPHHQRLQMGTMIMQNVIHLKKEGNNRIQNYDHWIYGPCKSPPKEINVFLPTMEFSGSNERSCDGRQYNKFAVSE